MPGNNPAHLIIVGFLNEEVEIAPNTRQYGALEAYGKILRDADIPADHDVIIAAWKRAIAKHSGLSGDALGVIAALQAKKAAAAEKTKPAEG